MLTRKSTRIAAVVIYTISVLMLQTSGRVSAACTDAQTKIAISTNKPFYCEDDSVSSVACGAAAVQAAAGTLDRFLQVLAYQESGGNPKAESGSSTASGKYQELTNTWKSDAKTYYPPALQYSTAGAAPEEVQDAVNYIKYTRVSKVVNGDLTRMAIYNLSPAAATTQKGMDTRIGKNPTPREYGAKFASNLAKGIGSNIPIKYSSAPDFSSWLAKAGGDVTTSATTTPTVSETCKPGQPAANFVFYDQTDARWANHAFGSSTIKESGCGPTSVAMIVATLKDQSVTPLEVADFGTSIGGYIENVGSDHEKMLVKGPEHWGLRSVYLGTDISAAINALNSGSIVIASGTGAEPYTKGGHIIVLRGVTSEGKFLIGDPFSSVHKDADTKEYSQASIISGLAGLWAVSK